MSINAASYENGVLDGTWNVGATTTQIRVTVYNNGSVDLPMYKIRPLLSVGSGITFNASQPNLPAGWSILANTGTTIRFSNGTDMIPVFDSRDFYINVTPTAIGSYTFTANIFWSTGVAPGSASGPATAEDDPGNNSSITTSIVSTALPLHLTRFGGTAVNCSAVLEWKTEEESNTSHFEVEQSADGVSFSQKGKTTAQGNGTGKNYSLSVAQDKGTALYRLKMVDRDGKFTYSNIIAVKVNCGGEDYIRLYPNLVSAGNQYATLSFKLGGYTGRAEVVLLNTSGQQVSRQAVTIVSGANNVRLNTELLPAGTYYVQLLGGGGEKLGITQKLLKQQ
jgi:archaellum component FlaF (FlaF/FlaG flagellin family)